MKRKGFVAANWKMNGTQSEVLEFCKGLNNIASEVDVVFSPPSIFLAQASKNKQNFDVAPQTASQNDNGAFTGEISMPMVKELDCKYVILGHSERRAIFGETNKEIFAKVKKAIDNKIIPILCIGETDQENQDGKTQEVLSSQLELVIENISEADLQEIVIAYEPVWAIGTGRTPSIDDIEEIHQKIRSMLAKRSDTIANSVRILYGGSVNAKNAQDIFSCENVDGGLVGGASLTIDSFEQVIKAY